MPKFTACIHWKASPGDLKYYKSKVDSLEDMKDSLNNDKIYSFLSCNPPNADKSRKMFSNVDIHGWIFLNASPRICPG